MKNNLDKTNFEITQKLEQQEREKYTKRYNNLNYVDFSNPNADKISSASTTTIKQETLEQIVSKQFQKEFNKEVGKVLVQELKKKEMKQTAVEWLEEALSLAYQIEKISLRDFTIKKLFKQAKEMEKEQILDAIIISEKEHIIQGNVYPPQFVVDKAKKYYNETFKN